MGLRRPKVFLDSSVILAGMFRSEGGSGALIYAIELRLVDAYVSELVIAEVSRNLIRKGSSHASTKFNRLLDVGQITVVPDPTLKQVIRAEQLINVKDAPILAAALTVPIDILVTLDTKDFAPLRKQHDIPFAVMTPGEFLPQI